MIWLECALLLLCFAMAFTSPLIGNPWLNKAERSLQLIASHRALAVVLAGATALALRAAVLPILPIPYPSIPDEFAYRLSGDTFSHGRLTNPAHPMWVHFECPNVIQQPTYSSIYYPAQGASLALGQVVTGYAFWGVWLSIGLMCGAICWMLQGWAPPVWALVGGLLAAIRLGAVSYWDNSYFGGAVTALGGALVLGALPRIRRSQRVRDGVILAIGFALLFNSRPYESLFFSIPVGLALIAFAWKSIRLAPRPYFLRVALPFALVLITTAAFMLYFFWRTTGNPFLAPYVVNLQTYAVEPNFAWLPLRPIPHYHSDLIRRYWTEWDVNTYLSVRAHPVITVLFKTFLFWLFYLGPLLTIPFIGLAIARMRGRALGFWDRKAQFLALVIAVNLVGVLLVVPVTPLYLAPATAAVYGLAVMAMQRVRHCSVRSRPAVFLVRTVPALAVLLLLVRIAIPVLHLPISNPGGSWTWSASWEQLLPRKHIEQQLLAQAGEHLVIVHYGPQHDPKQAWCSNSADIDGSKIVWATDLGPTENKELLGYFSQRRVWLIDPDQKPLQLRPYEPGLTGVPTVKD